MALQLLFWTGWTAKHVTGFPFRSSEAARVKPKIPDPTMLTLKLVLCAWNDSWAQGMPPVHSHRYCRST